MYKKGLIVLTVITLLTYFLAAGCNLHNLTEPGPGTGEENSQLIFAVWSAPDGVFNFNLMTSYYDQHCVWPVFDSLLGFQPDLSYYSNLAEEWEIRDDGLTFYYKLRDDIYWHDGVPVTSEDVKFTFEWMMHPDYTGPGTYYWEKIKGFEAYHTGEADQVEGIVILSDREIEFHFTQVDAPAHFNVSTWKISPYHIFKETPVAELDNHPAVLNPIGSGPFKFERYQEGQYVELVKNESYHLGAPGLDRIIIKVSNPDAAQAELLTGRVDAALIAPNADE
ncbi:MAG: ABC transporter substrate-binding protein, partial [Firmicutes bacterium HGW-Firmicutes-13]